MASPTESPRLRDLARLLDEAIRIPGTNIRIGLDALLGLLPGGGDVAGGLLSGLIILQAARDGAPATVLGRMLGNVALDVVAGAVPLLGDIFDVAWRANSRNIRLLQSWRERPVSTKRSSRVTVAVILGALVLLIALAVWGSIALFGALFDSLRGT
ncbi:MAG TPA: DUF4112 domain-containing protein [Gemmatimonadaceae bacterium]|nr:DUF4112 domain-containing protein [Gemmatimonadaceae bacterium]